MQQNSQVYEAYVPVYDTVPETWEDAKPFLVEQLKRISNELNVREIGWLLDEELLAGKFLFPGEATAASESNSNNFRSVFRKVISFPSLSAGANSQLHGVSIDANFTLVSLTAAVTDAATLTGKSIPSSFDTVTYNATSVVISVSRAWTRGLAIMEYVQEL